MNTSLRDQLIAVGYQGVPTPKMNNSYVGKPSPTMNACHQIELYQHRRTIYRIKRKSIIAKECAYAYTKISKSRILRAQAFEASFQATRKAERELNRG
jgi:hypothetical protein